ncbi:MAG: histidine kinase [Terrimicrobiaceae bacterium]|nr:histidine kinase [Terrimicrobiaceae bacterium]
MRAGSASFWRWNLLVWIGIAIFAVIARFSIYPSLEITMVSLVFQLALALVLSGVIRMVLRRPSISPRFRLRTALWIVLLSGLAGFVHSSLVQFALDRLEWNNPNVASLTVWLFRTKIMWLIYMCWCLGYLGVRSDRLARSQHERARQAREEARKIELQMLRAQLDPHFLFNSLNGIAAEIRPHPDAATAMVTELAEYLRYSLDHRDRVLAPLAAELDAMSAYLAIESARFGENLVSEVSAGDDVRRREVPCFLLQPMVENAIKHGWKSAGPNPLRVTIRAWQQAGLLEISVYNSGLMGDSREEGVGLSTLRRRLDIHYPGRHSFRLEQRTEGVEAHLVLEGEPCFA